MLRDNDIKVIDESRQGEAVAVADAPVTANGKKFYVESYGCAMNFSDSEIVASILISNGYSVTTDYKIADAIFLNTCAIRENAEQRVRQRLSDFKKNKKQNPDLIIGVLGCMAERLKSKLLEEEKLVDIVVGPDAYRDLPNLISSVEGGQKGVNVLLSLEETYSDINPIRLATNGVTAFISIMRGCDNMCSFCVVPFTRGRERSRDPYSIIKEAEQLFENGYREVTLLGQNVDSYLWHPDTSTKKEILKAAGDDNVTFANLLEMVAKVHSDLRVRFSTSNPRDMTDDVLHAMAKHENICKNIHLPVQSGDSDVLFKMNRGYTRQDYMKRIEAIRNILPGCGISTDIISGFCGETDEQHKETLSLMEWAGFDFAYMFKYSERPGTAAAKKFEDNITEEIKSKRLQEIVDLQLHLSAINNKQDLGNVHKVLVEGISKKSSQHFFGRNSQNKVVVFPKENFRAGDYVNIHVTECTAATLIGAAI